MTRVLTFIAVALTTLVPHLAHAQNPSRCDGAKPVATAPTTLATPAAPPATYVETGDPASGAVHPGTTGAATQPVPAYRGGSTFAILGDAAPVNEATPGYLQQIVEELNGLRPDLVLTTGNQVAGYTRSVAEYTAQLAAYRTIIGPLQMPVYFCAGDHDVVSGTRDPADRRFERLFEKSFGPLYYSVDFRDLHFITLYSEGPGGITDTQLAWLRSDLNRAFDSHKTAHVFVLVHRPLWRRDPALWQRIHQALVAFNRRPIVTVEGLGGAPAGKSPQVEAVFAGHERAFSRDQPRDGIGYYVLGPAGAQLQGDALGGAMEHVTLVHVDTSGIHVALLQPGHVLPDDYVTAHDREILDKIAALDDSSLGIQGVLDQPVSMPVGVADSEKGTLEQILNNPLDVPLDVEFRMASAKNLVTQAQKDAANPATDNYDSLWELHTPYGTQHLDPGQKLHYHMALFSPAQGSESAPPQVEFVVNWIDSKGRTVPTVLKRRVPLIPSATVPLFSGALRAATWDTAFHGGTYSWIPNPHDQPRPAPDFSLLADQNTLYVRVRVSGKAAPTTAGSLDEPWNLPCDAVAVAWAASQNSWDSSVQRVVLVAPTSNRVAILTNSGVGRRQSKLLPHNETDGIVAMLTPRDDDYEVALMLPRSLVMPSGSCVLNITVTNNDGGAVSTWRSWARDDLGPSAWGRVKIQESAPPAERTK